MCPRVWVCVCMRKCKNEGEKCMKEIEIKEKRERECVSVLLLRGKGPDPNKIDVVE